MGEINYTMKQYVEVQKYAGLFFIDNIILKTYQTSVCSAHNELNSTQLQVYYTQKMSTASFNHK
jgi:hypothetical protein